MVRINDLIWSREVVKKFYDNIVPELGDDEVMIIMGQIRRKYVNIKERDFGHDPVVARRVIRRNDWNEFLSKVIKVSHELMSSVNYTTGKPFPLYSMVIYIDIFPKDIVDATFKLKQDIDKLLKHNINTSDDSQISQFKKLDVMSVSAYHKASSDGRYIILDVDDPSYHSHVWNFLRRKNVERHVRWLTRTRGGYHFIFDKDRDLGKILYVDMREFFKSEFADNKMTLDGVTMTPLPGTVQGGYEVKNRYVMFGDAT